MARNSSRLKMGFFPLPEEEARRISSLLSFSGPCSVVDPCAGKGAALNLITAAAPVVRIGVELDTARAEEAASSGIRMIQGNSFDAQAKVESFSLLYLNPPYDSEIDLVGNRRMERLFLEHTHRWLVQHGVLIFVIPFEQFADCASILAVNFTRIAAFRMTAPESIRFRQIVVFGIRRNVRGAAHEENLRKTLALAAQGGYSKLPELTPDAIEPFAVPRSGEASLSYRGLPYNLIEDLLPHSAAWRQAAQVMLPREDMAIGRPITPLHGGHVGLLCTAGLLNGVFGQGEERHIARWRSVKHVTEFHEEEGDTKILRRREKWSNELRLLYITGKAMKLTESAPKEGDSDGECASEDGPP
jgi:tRNA1(Val) A37 N6-methylase TrmN6